MPQDKIILLPTPSNPVPLRKLAYREWGDANAPAVICVHGLSRLGRDFDPLAEKLSAKYRVICPDMAGRGGSDWLDDKNQYNYFTYIADISLLLAQLRITQLDWIGTSMGGIIGMMMGAQNPALIKRMVINDIGSVVSAAGLQRILTFVGSKTMFDSRAEAMDVLKTYLAPFGITQEADWQFMCDITFKPLPDGKLTFHYDPDITKPFREAATQAGTVVDVDLTAFWALLHCPILILRGSESDILSKATAQAMLNRAYPTKLVEFQNVGHAPALLSPDQIQTITEWLA